jgi:hypothetical protein
MDAGALKSHSLRVTRFNPLIKSGIEMEKRSNLWCGDHNAHALGDGNATCAPFLASLRKQSSELFVFWAAGTHPTTRMSSDICFALESVSRLDFCSVVICGLSANVIACRISLQSIVDRQKMLSNLCCWYGLLFS